MPIFPLSVADKILALFFSATTLTETRNYLLYSLLYAPTDGNMGVAKMPPLWNPLTPVQAIAVVVASDAQRGAERRPSCKPCHLLKN